MPLGLARDKAALQERLGEWWTSSQACSNLSFCRRLNRREIPRLRVPALRAKANAREASLGMTIRGRCGSRRPMGLGEWLKGSQVWLAGAASSAPTTAKGRAAPYFTEKRKGRAIEAGGQRKPSMFGGHGMPCPYDCTGGILIAGWGHL